MRGREIIAHPSDNQIRPKSGIYLSFPITGRDDEELKAEREQMMQHAKSNYPDDVIVDPTQIPTIVHAMRNGYRKDDREFYSFCMGECVKWLLRCRAAVFAPGYWMSDGCRAEHAICEIYGIPAIHLDVDQEGKYIYKEIF